MIGMLEEEKGRCLLAAVALEKEICAYRSRIRFLEKALGQKGKRGR